MEKENPSKTSSNYMFLSDITPSPHNPSKIKSKKILIFFCILLAIVGVSICAFYFYRISQQPSQGKPEPITQSSEKSDEQKIHTKSPNERTINYDEMTRATIIEIKKIADGQMKICHNNGCSSYVSTKTFNENYPIYKSKTLKTFTLIEQSYGINIDVPVNDTIAESKIAKITPAIEKKLIEIGFQKYNTDLDITQQEYLNEKTGIICSLPIGSVNSYSAGCGHISWVSEEKITLINELFDAINKHGDTLTISYLNASPSDIINSKVAPYQRLTASIWSAVILFYRENPQSEWKMIDGGQGLILCDKYNADAKKAYAGEQCFDANFKEITL